MEHICLNTYIERIISSCLHACIERILSNLKLGETSLLGSSAISKVEVTELRFEPAPFQFANENSTTQPNSPFLAKFLRVRSRDAKLLGGGRVRGVVANIRCRISKIVHIAM